MCRTCTTSIDIEPVVRAKPQPKQAQPHPKQTEQSVAVAVCVAGPVAVAPRVVVMSGSGMILMELAMQIAQRPVIGAVLRATIEAFLMSAPVRFANVAMEPPVRPMIALMLPVVAVVMRKRRCDRCRQGQHSRRDKCLADCHCHLPPGPK